MYPTVYQLAGQRAAHLRELLNASIPISRGRKAYIVTVLVAVFVCNAADRYALAALIQPIKREFHLTDGAAGLLIGLAFAFAYCVCAIPLGRAVDRSNRVRFVAGCLAVWSLFTAAFAATANFWQILLARSGVAAAESGAYAAVLSLIGDYFPAQRRGAVISCLQFGVLLGMMGGLALAGWLAELHGWRTAFLVFGLGGLPLALLIFLTVREPLRGAADHLMSATRADITVAAAFKELFGRRAYRLTLVGTALAYVAMYGSVSWFPALLARKLALTTAQSGLLSGILIPVPMMLGTLSCGLISDRLYRRDKRWSLWIPAIGFACAAPCIPILVWAPGREACFTAIALFAFLCSASNVSMLSMIMTLSGSSVRGTSASIVAFVAILLGNGVGAAIIGFSSDLIRSLSLAQQPLGVAIALTAVPLFCAAAPLCVAARHIEAGLSRARVFDESQRANEGADVKERTS